MITNEIYIRFGIELVDYHKGRMVENRIWSFSSICKEPLFIIEQTKY